MQKKELRITLFISILLIFTISICFSIKNYQKNTFGIEQFQKQLGIKGYNYEIQDSNWNLIQTAGKQIIIGEDNLTIYLFNSNENMEKEAKNIDKLGEGYDNGSSSLGVDWVSLPHFFKKGRIIVQYIGVNEKIISDLKDILGEQFAGR
jgi:hypothetical protein